MRWTVPVVAGVIALAIVGVALAPGRLVSPNAALLKQFGADIYATTEDEIATVEAGQLRSTPELWVAGTSMTLLTVDANLMPVLPLIARPDSKRALIVAFGMGTAFRSAADRRAEDGRDRARAVRPEDVPLLSPGRRRGPREPERARSSSRTAGTTWSWRTSCSTSSSRTRRRRSRVPGASVISSREYYEAGRDHLTPGGVMMQWIPYGQTINEYKAHIRAFHSVFPEVAIVFGPGGYGNFMLGSMEPISLEPDAIREVLARPGVLEDISSAFDSPTDTVEGWVDEIAKQTWISGDAVTEFVGDGPEVTDDRPLSEYFLIRRILGDGTGRAVPSHPQGGCRAVIDP